MDPISNDYFLLIINKVYGNILRDHELEIHEEKERLIIAKKGDIELLFRLETIYKSYLFSLEVRLVGELGTRVTSDLYYRFRPIGVATIATVFDPNYRVSLKKPQTEEDLIEKMEEQKQLLTKYCIGILEGDVAILQKVIDYLIKNRAS